MAADAVGAALLAGSAAASSVTVDAHAEVAPASAASSAPVSTRASDSAAALATGGAAALPAAAGAGVAPEASPQCAFDVILGADIIWVPELIPPLVRSIAALARSSHRALVQRKRRRTADVSAAGPARAGDGSVWPCMARCAATATGGWPAAASGATCTASTAACASGSCDEWPLILIAHQTRSRASDRLFSALLAEQGFEWTPLPHGDHHAAFQDRDINILRVTPRAEMVA